MAAGEPGFTGGPVAPGSNGDKKMGVLKLFELASRMDKIGVTVTRVGLIVVLLWIGGLKAFQYEADGIVPFVANSPTMNFFYADPGNYKAHRNPEGALVPENRSWHEANRTYLFAYGLGSVIVLYGLLLCLHPWLPQAAAVGSFLVFVMSFVTLSFLITTPECWVPPLGDANHGFPYLSGVGRLVIKDAIMMGAALVTMADSAKAYLRKRASSLSQSKVAVNDQRLVTASV
jgi:reactive chlorine resistance protein C